MFDRIREWITNENDTKEMRAFVKDSTIESLHDRLRKHGILAEDEYIFNHTDENSRIHVSIFNKDMWNDKRNKWRGRGTDGPN